MTAFSEDYFVYLPDTPEKTAWGYTVRGAGRANVKPNSPYPPLGHPDDHHFDWKKGRVLKSLQLIHLSSGSGTLETASAKKQALVAGCAFLVFPGEWHRYRPDPRTGWRENWVELDGRCVRDLLDGGILSPSTPVLSIGSRSAIEAAFHELHQLLCGDITHGTSGLSLLAHRVMHICLSGSGSEGVDPRIACIVHTAERHLAKHCATGIDLPSLAASWGVSYSTFRRAFAERTGISPWQYVVRARLDLAARALVGSDATLEEIASSTGFGSGFHLANTFKKIHGLSPGAWRKAIREKSREATDSSPSRPSRTDFRNSRGV